jgi:two-component system C4-dicarboxylate transport response regulator DctD
MHNKKILIVEDEKEVAQSLEDFLRDEGFSAVERAADGIHAIRQAQKFMPDLILLDLKMPGGDGITVLKKLRQIASTAKIPIIVITGVADDTIKKRLLSSGVCAHFQKPYKPELLVAGIKNALERRSSSEEAWG